MQIENIITELQISPSSINAIDLPDASGICAVYLKDRKLLPFKMDLGVAPLYLGSSSNLSERELENHFKTNGSGFSTLRRSLGAILKSELNLTAIPRGPGSSPSNFSNYKFETSGELRLTIWMKENLAICVKSIPVEYESLEKELIEAMKPPLCLKGWDNPLRKRIKALRKICSDEARRT